MEHFLQNIHEKTNQIVKEQMRLYYQSLEVQLNLVVISKLCDTGRILPGELLYRELNRYGYKTGFTEWRFPS